VQLYYRLTAIILCIFISACTYLPVNNCNQSQIKAVQDSIYFGTTKQEGYVTEEEWSRFLEATVTPRFPEGLTVAKVSGQWRRPDGMIIKERSYLLIIVHSGSENEECAISDIINIYKKEFQQEAVLRVKNAACISF
jgi:hypothetical protein